MDKRHSSRSAIAAWFVVGLITVGAVQSLWSGFVGGPLGMIQAGELEPAHAIVSKELPSAPISARHGHDGQIFFAIGTDLLASKTPAAIVPGYRYRRILFPATSSLFGFLDGEALVWGMIVTSAVFGGVLVASTAVVCSRLGLPWLAPLAAGFNPGAWFSGMYLTADLMALALGMTGVAAALTARHRVAVLALIAAALTRETHIIFAIGLAGYAWYRDEQKSASMYLSFPVISLAAWVLYVALRMGDGFSSGDNLDWPLVGVIGASSQWHNVSGVEQILTGITLTAILIAFWAIWPGRALFRWLLIPWLIVAALASHYVWDLGNNSIRTLAPLFTLGILGALARRRSLKNIPEEFAGI